jgi:hypothetical protein
VPISPKAGSEAGSEGGSEADYEAGCGAGYSSAVRAAPAAPPAVRARPNCMSLALDPLTSGLSRVQWLAAGWPAANPEADGSRLASADGSLSNPPTPLLNARASFGATAPDGHGWAAAPCWTPAAAPPPTPLPATRETVDGGPETSATASDAELGDTSPGVALPTSFSRSSPKSSRRWESVSASRLASNAASAKPTPAAVTPHGPHPDGPGAAAMGWSSHVRCRRDYEAASP